MDLQFFFFIFQQLTNRKLSADTLREHLLVVMRNATEMTFDLFDDFYNEIVQDVSCYCNQIILHGTCTYVYVYMYFSH